jgi:acetylornithine deacetylase/succinyl-diaminopimelate desuccinylase-like protein
MTERAWETHLAAHEAEYLDEVLDLLRIPSISTGPEHRDDVRRAAEWVADRMRRAGIPEVEIAPSDGHPIVLGRWMVGENRPTVMIYGHYDVQPAVPLELWRTPPFEPTIVDGRIYARGASDMKANLLSAIQAIEALRATAGAPPVNVIFFFEGEEETGSPNLPPFVAANRDRLKCDVVLSADSMMDGPDKPVLVTALKGIIGCQIDLRTGETDLHSGGYGAAVLNAAQVAGRLAASFHNSDGTVAINGFYDAVLPLTELDRADIALGAENLDGMIASSGVYTRWGEAGYTDTERVYARPTLDLNGMWSGFTGEGAKTVTPCEAHIKLTCRLVPDQDPDAVLDLIRAHVERHIPAGVQATITPLNGAAYPFAISRDHPAMLKTGAVLKELYGVEPTHVRVGASIPVTGIFQRELGADTVELGFSQPGSGAHAPNEWYRLDDLALGRRAYCAVLEALAT